MRRLFVLVPACLLIALVLTPVTQPAAAQSYSVEIDFVFQTSDLIGQTIDVFGRIVVVTPRIASDNVTVALRSPEGTVERTTIPIPADAVPPEEFAFQVGHATVLAGEFTLVVSSQAEAAVIHEEAFPVSAYEVSVEVVPLAEGASSDILVRTVVDIGEMDVVFSRFDVEYTLDDRVFTEMDTVVLVDPDLIDLVELPPNPRYGTWEFLQTFSLSQGNHTLEVRVIDLSVALEVHAEAFQLSVGDDLASLRGDLGEARGDLNDLQNATGSLQQASAVTLPLSALSVVALGASLLSLLIQFGLLTVRRRGQG